MILPFLVVVLLLVCFLIPDPLCLCIVFAPQLDVQHLSFTGFPLFLALLVTTVILLLHCLAAHSHKK